MADDADSPENTGTDRPNDDTPKTNVPKDRQCPFCHLAFTSSSLGRHLDLYIKQKNPKPPDGVHDVEKIRQMRGKITRRHPKGYAAAAREQAQAAQADADGVHATRRPGMHDGEGFGTIASSSPFVDTINEMPNMFNPTTHGGLFAMSRMNWQQTGVINEPPPKANGAPLASREPGDGRGWPSTEPLVTDGSTAELALYDIVKNLQRAAVRMQRPGPFDFDLFALNFPAMCLKLLPPPPTLFSTTPLHSNVSWPIDPPVPHHLEVVKNAIRRKLKAYIQVCPPLGSRLCTSKEELERHLNTVVDEEFVKYEEHTNCVHSQWVDLSDDQRQQVWHLEVLRAYSKQIKDHSCLSTRYERAQDTIAELKQENERLRTMRSSEGNRLGQSSLVSQALLREVAKIDADPAAWAFQTVLDRYKDWTPGSRDDRSRTGAANGASTANRSDLGGTSDVHAQRRNPERASHGSDDVEMGEDGSGRGGSS